MTIISIKNRTFKIMGKIISFPIAQYSQNKCPFQLSTTLTTRIQVMTHRVVLVVSLSRPRRVNFPESSSSSNHLVESSSSSGDSSSHPRRVIESSSSHAVKIESSSSSVEVPLENSSIYLFICERQ